MGKKADKSLTDAVQRGDKQALLAALEGGAALDDCDRHGATLLHLAAGAGRMELVELLIERGAPLDKTDDAGNTALMLAAARGQAAAVKRLLTAGASMEAGNNWGQTVRDWAKWPANSEEIHALLAAAQK